MISSLSQRKTGLGNSNGKMKGESGNIRVGWGAMAEGGEGDKIVSSVARIFLVTSQGADVLLTVGGRKE